MVQYHWYSPNNENIGHHEYTATYLKTVKLKCIQIFPMYWFDPVFSFLFFRGEKFISMMVLLENSKIKISPTCLVTSILVTDLGDEIIRCWWQLYDVGDSFGHFGHQHSISFYTKMSGTNIQTMSPTSLIDHQF